MKYYSMHMKHQKWHTKYFTAFLGSEIERVGPFACAGYVSLCQSFFFNIKSKLILYQQYLVTCRSFRYFGYALQAALDVGLRCEG